MEFMILLPRISNNYVSIEHFLHKLKTLLRKTLNVTVIQNQGQELDLIDKSSWQLYITSFLAACSNGVDLN